MDRKIEELKKEKRTLKTSNTKLLNELASELSTKTPNKKNVTAKLQDIDNRRDELLELLDSLQTLYGENKHASLAASTGDEAVIMTDRVDNELGFSYRNVTATKAKEITQAISAHLRAYVEKMVMWSTQTNSSSGFESQSFWATRKNISRGGQRFPVVWMKQICRLSLKCCGSKVGLVGEAAETVKGLGYSNHAYEAAKARFNRKYGRNRRQVQAHIGELRKMRPINADKPRELERFADIVERTVVSLKENKKFADLEGGTLYSGTRLIKHQGDMR